MVSRSCPNFSCNGQYYCEYLNTPEHIFYHSLFLLYRSRSKTVNIQCGEVMPRYFPKWLCQFTFSAAK